MIIETHIQKASKKLISSISFLRRLVENIFHLTKKRKTWDSRNKKSNKEEKQRQSHPTVSGDGGKRPGITAALEQEDGPRGKIVLAKPNLGDYFLCSKIARGMNK